MNIKQPSKKNNLASIRKYADAVRDLAEGRTAFSWNSKPVKAVPADWIRVASSMKSEALESMVRNMMLNAFLSAESRYVGSSLTIPSQTLNYDSEKILHKRMDWSQLQNSLKGFLGDGLCCEAALLAFERAGHDSAVGFSVSQHDYRMTIKSRGAVKIPGQFCELFDAKPAKVNGCSVILINGVLESISELESLMRTASESARTVILIANSFDGDILKTLDHNWKKNSLRILPFKSSLNHDTDDVLRLNQVGVITIDLENMMQMKKITSEMLLESNLDVVMEDDGIQIMHDSGSSRLVEVVIPKNMHELSGLIEDRILNGLAYCRLACLSGLHYSSALDLNVPIISYNQSIKVGQVLQKNLNNVGCILEID